MRVTYFSKYSDHGPSSRYRAFQLKEHFQRVGIDFRIQMLFDDRYFEILRSSGFLGRNLRKCSYVASRFQERRKALRSNRATLSIIEQQLFPYLPFALERAFLPERYLVEFDDAVYLTHPRKLPKVLTHAAAVLAGNRTLAEYAGRYNRNVHIIPTVLDTDLFSPRPKQDREKVIIGWSGIEYNFKYVRMLEPVFVNLMSRYNVEILILAGSRPEFSFPFRFQKWESEREVTQMNEFDIGVMPLEMDEWCRGKCGLKLLQYMSLGVASVATPAGVNAEIIREGENGFTAVTRESWEKRLSQLIEDAGLREKIGMAARATVVEHYSIRTWFPQILRIYQTYTK